VAERSLELEARLDSLRALGLWLHQTAGELALPYEVAFALDLSLHEAVENAVRHGSREGVALHVRVSLSSDGHSVEAVVEDDGPAFDPLSVPAPRAPQRIEDVIPGGHGIQLMRHFTDEIRYRREGERNRLTLVRMLAPRGGGR
jgi:anti-sigma regulatory factor (Ser/Thr protein kinase)